MVQPIASWNTVRGVWEIPGMVNLFCEHWAAFSETWPISGTMRNGQVFERQMPAHHTVVSEFSFSPIPEESMLRTPSAIEGDGGAITEDQARARNRMLQVRDQMAQLAAENGLKVSESISSGLLPTPNTMDMLPRRSDEALARSREKGGASNLKDAEIVRNPTLSWGKFEPAIIRWENILGRSAPAPTKPDGKEGNHRLSSRFTEWMMGLPEGWITDCGLTRNEELKACGNGVVPQQAAYALKSLKESMGND